MSPVVPPGDLLAAAKRVRKNAYAPYSNFQVGAALRTAEGIIIAGANVENASFGLSRCAEQSAVQAMISQGERSFGELLVYTEAPSPATPCGACRQILLEFAPTATLYLVNHQGLTERFLVTDLLPHGFTL